MDRLNQIQSEVTYKLNLNFLYTIKQGIKGTFKNKTMGFLSVISVSAVLVILGVVMSIVTNINEFISATEEEVNEVKVIIESSITEEEKKIVEEEILKIDMVNNVEYQTKEDSFENLQSSWGEDAHLLNGLENPLDDLFIVTVEDSTQIESIESELNSIANVKEIDYHQDVMENFISISTNVTKFGTIIMAFLLLVCLVLISNTIRSKVHSKKEEIQIIKYVGGSNSFITGPFIVEGFIIGSIGAIISIVSCLGIYKYTMNNLAMFSAEIIDKTLLSMNELSIIIVPILILTGIGIGVIGSIISVKRYIRV